MVAHPKPVATLRCESGFGSEDRKSLLHRPSCQVISWLTSLVLNMWPSSPWSQQQADSHGDNSRRFTLLTHTNYPTVNDNILPTERCYVAMMKCPTHTEWSFLNYYILKGGNDTSFIYHEITNKGTSMLVVSCCTILVWGGHLIMLQQKQNGHLKLLLSEGPRVPNSKDNHNLDILQFLFSFYNFILQGRVWWARQTKTIKHYKIH